MFAGKCYSKAMRAHKLTVQCLWRILIPKFFEFLNEENAEMVEKINDEVKKYIDGGENFIDLMLFLQTDEWRECFSKFIVQECDKSPNFRFWWMYMEMVSALLMFTRAQRDGDWELYMTSFRKMIPFFFIYDHQNYARWGVIYFILMMQIPEEIREEFLKGNFVVKFSNQRFSQVDPDHAQEWLNRRGKVAGGIIGRTRITSALMKWTLSYNARSFISDQTYRIYGLEMDNLVTKETTNARKSRDNFDEDKLLETLKSFNVLSENSENLVNIATKDIATDDIQESLLNAEKRGEIIMRGFVHRIIQGTGNILAEEFYKNIEKNKVKTFDSLYSRNVTSKDKEKNYVIKTDRKSLVRIITAYNLGRQVDLPDILCSEMMPVPLALAEINSLLKSGDKAVLQRRLLENIVCTESIDLNGKFSCLLIDGQGLVVSIDKTNCKIFGDLADHFIRTMLWHGNVCERIDLIFDRYRDNSIK